MTEKMAKSFLYSLYKGGTDHGETVEERDAEFKSILELITLKGCREDIEGRLRELSEFVYDGNLSALDIVELIDGIVADLKVKTIQK
jgi:hypothetical protein